MTHRTTLNLSPAQLDALRRIADRLGYLADRGPTKGSGSVSALVQAIADGELAVVDGEHFADVTARANRNDMYSSYRYPFEY